MAKNQFDNLALYGLKLAGTSIDSIEQGCSFLSEIDRGPDNTSKILMDGENTAPLTYTF